MASQVSGSTTKKTPARPAVNSSTSLPSTASSSSFPLQNQTAQSVARMPLPSVAGLCLPNGTLDRASTGEGLSQLTHVNNVAATSGTVPSASPHSQMPAMGQTKLKTHGKKTKGRVKIKMEFIDNKLRRYTTFSKRKAGLMKKAYELSTLTGTEVMLLVASETGHVYTFATRKLQPMITSEAGKALIQTCLNSPDLPAGADADTDPASLEHRLSLGGAFEEVEMGMYDDGDYMDDDDSSNEADGDSENPTPSSTSTASSSQNGLHNVQYAALENLEPYGTAAASSSAYNNVFDRGQGANGQLESSDYYGLLNGRDNAHR